MERLAVDPAGRVVRLSDRTLARIHAGGQRLSAEQILRVVEQPDDVAVEQHAGGRRERFRGRDEARGTSLQVVVEFVEDEGEVVAAQAEPEARPW